MKKENQPSSVVHTFTQVKRPQQHNSKRTETKDGSYLSPLNDPLGDVINGNVTPQRSFHNGGEGTRLARMDHQSAVTHVSAFDRMYVGTAQTTKNDMILNIVPKDPHLSNLAEVLQRQAREYQQKQLIESFPVRYNDLLSKEQQLAELIAKHSTLQQTAEDLQNECRRLTDVLAEREAEQSDKELKIQGVLQEAELERERLLQAVRNEHESDVKAVEQQRKEQRLRADLFERENAHLLQELQQVIEDRKQKELQIGNLNDALRMTKEGSESVAAELAKSTAAFQKYKAEQNTKYAQLTGQATRLQEEIAIIARDRDQYKEGVQTMSFENGVLMERLQRAQQQRLQFKVQWEEVRLDLNQQKTIVEERDEQLKQLTSEVEEAADAIEKHSFVVTQLQGQITLKQVELGDKTADLLTLKERLAELQSQAKLLIEHNETLTRQKTDLHVGATESQQQLKQKIAVQQDTISRLQDEVEFTRKENSYLLAIREELEAENDELHRSTTQQHQQLELTHSQRQNLERHVGELRKAFEAAVTSNQEELETLKAEVANHLVHEQQCKREAEEKHQRVLGRATQLEDECQRLKAAVDRHIKALASKEVEHDKVVSKLIEVSNSRTVLVDKENAVLLEEANKKLVDLQTTVSDKEEQIKSLQTLLRETKATILCLSESLKERTARQKELFDEVLSEKRRMKKQIQALEGELRQYRNK